MWVVRQADGTLRVPVWVEAEDGQLGDGTVEIRPDHPDYQDYLSRSIAEDEYERRMRPDPGRARAALEHFTRWEAGRLDSGAESTADEELPEEG